MLKLWTVAVLLSIASPILCQDEPGVKWMPSPHYSTGRSGYTAKYLIIHGTAGGSSAEAIGNWFQNPDSKVSAHYVVDQQGDIVQCVNEKDTAWANGRIESGADSWWGPENPNLITISIEHVKSATDNSNEITPAQKAATIALSKNIIARNPGIKAAWADSTSGITGHYSISPISRARCPGPFPWEEYFSGINDGNPVEQCIGTVTANSLHIRAEPTSASASVGGLNQGAVVTLLSRATGENVGGNTGWFYVNTATGTGYISGYYVNIHDTNKPVWCY